MKVGVFVPSSDPRHIAALHAFARGVQASGDEPILHPVETYKDCDVAVVFGMYKSRVPTSWPRGKILSFHRARGKPVIVIDTGYVKRADYYMVGLNGLNGRADFNNAGRPSDRWDALETPLMDWQRGEAIVVCGQVPWDASVQHSDHLGWCRSVVAHLNKRTNRPIIFRPHPLATGANYSVMCEQSIRPLEEDLARAYAVVTFNSNVGVDAMIAGIPAFAFDEGSMIWPICDRGLDKLGEPSMPDREQWASNLAYAQWNLAEMAGGLPWRHLREKL